MDWSDKGVATAADIDDETVPSPPVTQRTAQRRHIDCEVGRFDKNIRPNPSHQVFVADQFTAVFKQCDQDFQSTTSEGYGLVAFQQKELPRQ